MPGSSELIIIISIAVFFFFILPRMNRASHKHPVNNRKPYALSGLMRLAIVSSIIWIIIAAALLKPWEGDLLKFSLLGFLPVAAAWGSGWVVAGFKKST